MKSLLVFSVAAASGALFAAEPALAAAPPAQTFGTDCFSVSLPKSRFTMFRRKKLDNARPYVGSWGFGNQDGSIKIYFRCTALRTPNVQVALKASMPHLLKRVRDWKPLEAPTVEKDEKGRPIISVVGQGDMPVLDKKTGQVGVVTQLIARTIMHYPARKIQVSITAIVAHARAKELGDLMSLVGDSFDLIDLKEKLALKARVVKPATSVKGPVKPTSKPAVKPVQKGGAR